MERDQAMKFMHDLLRLMSQKKGRTCSSPPISAGDQDRRQDHPVSNQVLAAAHTTELARSIMNDRQSAEFEATSECNFAISPRASAASGSTPSSSRPVSAWSAAPST